MDDLAEPAIPLVVMPGEAQRLWRRGCRLEREPGIRPAAKHLEQDRINLAALIYSGDRYARPRGPCLLGHSGEEAESRVYLAAVRRRNDHDVTLRLVQAGANVDIAVELAVVGDVRPHRLTTAFLDTRLSRCIRDDAAMTFIAGLLKKIFFRRRPGRQ